MVRSTLRFCFVVVALALNIADGQFWNFNLFGGGGEESHANTTDHHQNLTSTTTEAPGGFWSSWGFTSNTGGSAHNEEHSSTPGPSTTPASWWPGFSNLMADFNRAVAESMHTGHNTTANETRSNKTESGRERSIWETEEVLIRPYARELELENATNELHSNETESTEIEHSASNETRGAHYVNETELKNVTTSNETSRVHYVNETELELENVTTSNDTSRAHYVNGTELKLDNVTTSNETSKAHYVNETELGFEEVQNIIASNETRERTPKHHLNETELGNITASNETSRETSAHEHHANETDLEHSNETEHNEMELFILMLSNRSKESHARSIEMVIEVPKDVFARLTSNSSENGTYFEGEQFTNRSSFNQSEGHSNTSENSHRQARTANETLIEFFERIANSSSSNESRIGNERYLEFESFNGSDEAYGFEIFHLFPDNTTETNNTVDVNEFQNATSYNQTNSTHSASSSNFEMFDVFTEGNGSSLSSVHLTTSDHNSTATDWKNSTEINATDLLFEFSNRSSRAEDGEEETPEFDTTSKDNSDNSSSLSGLSIDNLTVFAVFEDGNVVTTKLDEDSNPNSTVHTSDAGSNETSSVGISNSTHFESSRHNETTVHTTDAASNETVEPSSDGNSTHFESSSHNKTTGHTSDTASNETVEPSSNGNSTHFESSSHKETEIEIGSSNISSTHNESTLHITETEESGNSTSTNSSTVSNGTEELSPVDGIQPSNSSSEGTTDSENSTIVETNSSSSGLTRTARSFIPFSDDVLLPYMVISNLNKTSEPPSLLTLSQKEDLLQDLPASLKITEAQRKDFMANSIYDIGASFSALSEKDKQWYIERSPLVEQLDSFPGNNKYVILPPNWWSKLAIDKIKHHTTTAKPPTISTTTTTTSTTTAQPTTTSTTTTTAKPTTTYAPYYAPSYSKVSEPHYPPKQEETYHPPGHQYEPYQPEPIRPVIQYEYPQEVIQNIFPYDQDVRIENSQPGPVQKVYFQTAEEMIRYNELAQGGQRGPVVFQSPKDEVYQNPEYEYKDLNSPQRAGYRQGKQNGLEYYEQVYAPPDLEKTQDDDQKIVLCPDSPALPCPHWMSEKPAECQLGLPCRDPNTICCLVGCRPVCTAGILVPIPPVAKINS